MSIDEIQDEEFEQCLAHFECVHCGECCRGGGTVRLDEGEVKVKGISINPIK